MNELIRVENGVCLLDVEISKKIAEFEKQTKAIKEAEEQLKQAILAEMASKNIIKIDNNDLTISYSAETYRESFDSKALKKDNEELYNKYSKISPVKPSIRIKVK